MILLRVLIFFLLLLLLPDWYIYRTYLSRTRSKTAKRIFWFPSIALLAGLLTFMIGRDALHDSLGLYLIVMLCVAVPKTVFALISLLLRGISRLFRFRMPHGWISLIPSLAVFGYVLFGAIEGKEHFQVKEVTFISPDLPDGFAGYRILQLSDIHSGRGKGNADAIQEAVDISNRQQADLIVFTGDLVNSRASELPEFMPALSQLKAKDGVYSITGNHDYGTYVHWDSDADREANFRKLIEEEKRMGWDVLMNENRILHRGNDSIALVGVENSGNPPFPDKADMPKAMKGTEGMFKVLLSHDPTHWRRTVLPDTDIQLMLAGHTHDMQISVFGFSASQFIYPEHRGLYLEGGRGLYVNIGLGYVLFPFRLGAWPEITVITLKQEK